MRLVGVGLGAQPVVDVQGGDPAGAGDADGEVEQAAGVAAPGEHHDDGTLGAEQAVGADALEQVVHHSSRWRAVKISVDSLKPLRRTSPIRSNTRWLSALSTTGRVTSTSPPAERAATREAMLTSRP